MGVGSVGTVRRRIWPIDLLFQNKREPPTDLVNNHCRTQSLDLCGQQHQCEQNHHLVKRGSFFVKKSMFSQGNWSNVDSSKLKCILAFVIFFLKGLPWNKTIKGVIYLSACHSVQNSGWTSMTKKNCLISLHFSKNNCLPTS